MALACFLTCISFWMLSKGYFLRFLVEGKARHVTVARILKEPTDYLLHVAHYLRGFHESADGLVQQRVLGRPVQLRIVGPLREDRPHEVHNRRALLAGRQVTRIDVEDKVLEEVLKPDFFVIGEEGN